MGIGDELIAAGQARRMRAGKDPRRVRIVDKSGMPRWHPIWENNPSVVHPSESGSFQALVNAPHCRPYIASKIDNRWVWKEYSCAPAEIVFSPAEVAFAEQRPAPVVVIEPTIKSGASPNKDWGLSRWDKLVSLARKEGVRLTQLRPPRGRALNHADVVVTSDFRKACAVLARARLYVGHEGAMHHAAAALGIPAIVIFGGYISPAQTGYADHHNFFTGVKPCGLRDPCPHCAKAMAQILPEMIFAKLKEVLS